MFEARSTTRRSIYLVPYVLCVVLAICATLPAGVRAQEMNGSVTASWDTDAPPERGWTVGDPIPLRLRVTAPAGFDVTLPELPQQWGPLEVREQSLQGPVTNEDGTITTVREATVALWSPGVYETPSLTVRYRDADGQLHEVDVSPLSITVASVLTEGDTEKRDLKPQASLPRPPVWPWVLAGTLVTALLSFAARWLLRRFQGHKVAASESVEPVDTRPPEAIAYEELDRIAALDLPARGELKRHYTLVTDCVRTYLERVYSVPAMDRTTSELLTALRRARMDGEATTVLRALLEESDLVKFARFRPLVEQARAAVVQARRLVDMTKPDRAPTAEEAGEPITGHGARGTHRASPLTQ